MHLVGSKGEYPYDEGKHLMSMAVLHAYGDDSGTHQGADFTLVLGYIASPRQWKLFRRDWNAALQMLAVPKGNKKHEFHAKEFFQPASWKSRKSPYYRWNKKKAETFLDRLLDTIHRYRLSPIGGATITEEFFQYSEDDRRLFTGAILRTRTRWHDDEFEVTEKLSEHESSPNHPYFVTFFGFLVEAMLGSGDSQVHLYLDRQKDIEARALAAFNSFKEQVRRKEAANLASITHLESEDEEGLQAADLYAYVWYRKLTDTMTEQLWRAFRVLTRKKPEIVVAGKRYFDNLLNRAAENRAAAIRKGFSSRS